MTNTSLPQKATTIEDVTQRVLQTIALEAGSLSRENIAMIWGDPGPNNESTESSWKNYYSFKTAISPLWDYRVKYYEEQDSDHVPADNRWLYKNFYLNLYPHDPKADPSLATAKMDYQDFARKLLTQGWTDKGRTRRATLLETFEKDGKMLEIGIVGESSETPEKITHDCIAEIRLRYDTRI